MAERVAERHAQTWRTQDERGPPKAKRVANFLLLKSDGPISGFAKNNGMDSSPPKRHREVPKWGWDNHVKKRNPP
jgi:hypothetical protein